MLTSTLRHRNHFISTSLLNLLLFVTGGGGRVLARLSQFEVCGALRQRGQAPFRRPRCQELPVIVDDHEGGEVGGAPHQLEGDAGAELDVRHVTGGGRSYSPSCTCSRSRRDPTRGARRSERRGMRLGKGPGSENGMWWPKGRVFGDYAPVSPVPVGCCMQCRGPVTKQIMQTFCTPMCCIIR